MKKTLQTFLALISLHYGFATDRVVQENGPTGTFASITEAINAAADGDRIVIYPRVGGDAYVENVNIDKSLQLVSAQDAAFYKIQGEVNLVPYNGRAITIIGAELTAGSISGTGSGWRTDVNIMACRLNSGGINLSNQFYAVVVSNVLANGSIAIAHGKIIGNELQNASRFISITGSTSIPNDTINIIANKTPRIFCSSDVFLNIYNNLIARVDFADYFYSIQYNFASTSSKMKIINNTIICPNEGGFNDNYYLNLSAPAIIKNNIFQRTGNAGSSNPSFNGTATSSASYNYYYTNGAVMSAEVNPVSLSTAPVNPATGALILPTAAANGADPSFEYYDLDLSVGDAGCYGGSYSLNNYFPITGSSRVYDIDMPFGLTTSSAPLNIKADGFDR